MAVPILSNRLHNIVRNVALICSLCMLVPPSSLADVIIDIALYLISSESSTSFLWMAQCCISFVNFIPL